MSPTAVGTSGERVEMTDVPAVTMEALLLYMYTGKIADIEKIAHKLLSVAEEYGLVAASSPGPGDEARISGFAKYV